MREISVQLKNKAPVPLHPKPMMGGRKVLARMEGNRHINRCHLHNLPGIWWNMGTFPRGTLFSSAGYKKSIKGCPPRERPL